MSEHDCSKCPYKRLCEEIEIEDLSCDDIKGCIEHQPTIEPKRGEWKRRIVDNGFNADWVCSECGYRVKTDFVDYNFCPNCGAKMDGEREGE